MTKPVAFVPTLPEPTHNVKRRRSTKTLLAAQCNICHRGTDPSNNRIVFCDSCNTAYHQFCHDPPISNDVVTVLEKEWLCGPCERSKQNIVEGTEGLIPAEAMSIDEACIPKFIWKAQLTIAETCIFLNLTPGALGVTPPTCVYTPPRTPIVPIQCT